jgi:AraC-like DNA-binding protein
MATSSPYAYLGSIPELSFFLKPLLMALDKFSCDTKAASLQLNTVVSEISNNDSPPHEKIIKLIQVGEHHCVDPLFAVRAAKFASVEQLGAIGVFAMSSSGLKELILGLQNIASYLRESDLGIRLMDKAGEGETMIGFMPDFAITPALSEYTLALISVYIPFIVGWPVKIKTVEFSHPPRGPIESYKSEFNSPVIFNSDITAIVLDIAPDKPFMNSNKRLFKELKLFFSRFIYATEEVTTDSKNEVKEIIRKEMIYRRPSESAVAEIMNISQSSLRRLLAQQGTNYRQELDTVLCESAIQYLTIEQLTTNEVAEKLHYSDSGSFQRAFKRWTGISPLQFIKKSS